MRVAGMGGGGSGSSTADWVVSSFALFQMTRLFAGEGEGGSTSTSSLIGVGICVAGQSTPYIEAPTRC